VEAKALTKETSAARAALVVVAHTLQTAALEPQEKVSLAGTVLARQQVFQVLVAAALEQSERTVPALLQPQLVAQV
jgi:hypothetical protein